MSLFPRSISLTTTASDTPVWHTCQRQYLSRLQLLQWRIIAVWKENIGNKHSN